MYWVNASVAINSFLFPIFGTSYLVQNINLCKMHFFLRNTLYCSREIIFPKAGFSLRENKSFSIREIKSFSLREKAKNGISLTEL